VVITAAGSGERLGAGIPKAFVELAGRAMLEWAVEGVFATDVVDRVVVAVPDDRVDDAQTLLGGRVDVVAGGSERPQTVLNALAALAAVDPEYVLIHDAARPLTPPTAIQRVIDALRAGSRAVIPVLPVSDTIKAVDANGVVLGTPERSGLRAVQTPQGFETGLLRRAYERASDLEVTDDASLLERMGVPVQTVAGDPLAFKITTPLDLQLARAVLSG